MDQRRNVNPHDLLREADPAAAGLTLVERAAELIRETEDNAAEIVARAETAVTHMQEEMRLAERVLEAAETRRRVAEAEAKDLRNKLEQSERHYQERIEAVTAELEGRIQAVTAESEERIETLTTELEGRIDSLTADLEAALKRGDDAEARAEEANHALDRIQSAMQGILKVRGVPGAEAAPEQAEQDERDERDDR
jgi:chromosome segregation ATPase